MAFEPYLLTRKRGCYRAPLTYKQPELTPECKIDDYTWHFRERWNTLQQGPCSRKSFGDPYACLLDRKYPLDPDQICISPTYDKWTSETAKKFQYPWSHNNIDDCCKAPCPCLENTKKKPDIKYICKPRDELIPLDDMTTHRYFFTPKPTPPRPQRRIQPWDPCDCPLDEATMYKLDYPYKTRVPNGPVMAEVAKHGMWSMGQFSDEPFPEQTENGDQFYPKCGKKRTPIRYANNLGPGDGPMETSSETCMAYPPKKVAYPPYPDWISDDTWVPSDTPLESCTTYKHFYRPYPFPPGQSKITSPKAIPFPTMHNMWYTCCDPKVDQRTPVEMKDDDPWPYVKPCPIRYQNNLQTDPCAPFRDDTTYKADYWAKKRCVKPENYAPSVGYTVPIQPFNDDTTNRVSYRAFTRKEYKGAKTSAGNPNGKKWGPFKCPPNPDKCLPQFPAPYGNPLKPYTSGCPCGPFDDRSTYHQDFKYRSREMVDLLNEEMCRIPNVPKGVSLYRHDFVDQEGKKAARMPPPTGKGYRCMNTCNIRDLDTLYRMDYLNFWETMKRKNLELYRGKPTIRNRRPKDLEGENCAIQDELEIFATPPGTTVQDVLEGRVSLQND